MSLCRLSYCSQDGGYATTQPGDTGRANCARRDRRDHRIVSQPGTPSRHSTVVSADTSTSACQTSVTSTQTDVQQRGEQDPSNQLRWPTWSTNLFNLTVDVSLKWMKVFSPN